MTDAEGAAPRSRRRWWQGCCLAMVIVFVLLAVLFVVWLALVALNRSTY